MLAEQALIGLFEFVFGLNDQEEVVACLGNDAIGNSTRNIDVIARFEVERAEIRFNLAPASMDEIQLVAVGIAEVEGHRLRAARDVETYVTVAEERQGQAFGVGQVGGFELVQIE